MRGHKDLRLLLAASAVCALLALVVPLGVARLVFALPLALFLPGYAVTLATFARHPIEPPKMALLSGGLSLALLPLGALILNYMPGGIRTGSWALLLFLIVLAGCRAAALRRPPGEKVAPAIARPAANRARAAVYGLAALAVVTALVLAFTALPAKHAIGYTELWIKPTAHGAARIGVRSDEQRPDHYQLVVRFGIGGSPIVREFPLKPGQGKILQLAGSDRTAAAPLPVTAALFRSGHESGAYRRASAWIPAAQ